MKYPRLESVWELEIDTTGEEIQTNGIFSYMLSDEVLGNVFDGLSVNAADLDIRYMVAHSGHKIVGPLVRKFLDENGEITDTGKEIIAKMIYRTNFDRWYKLVQTMLFDYDPITNYDMVEKLRDDITQTEYHKRTTHTYQNVKDEIVGSENRTLSEGSKQHTYNNVKDEIKGSENRTLSDGTKEHTYNNVKDEIVGSENRTLSDGTKTHTYNNVKDEISGSENRALSDGTKTHTYTNVKDAISGKEKRTTDIGTITESKAGDATKGEERERQIAGFNSQTYVNSNKETVVRPGGDYEVTRSQGTGNAGTDTLEYINRENTRTGSEQDAQSVDGKDNLTYNNRYNQRTGNETDAQSVDGKDNLTYQGRYNQRTGSEEEEQTVDGKDNLTYQDRYNQRSGSETDAQTVDGKDNLTYQGRYNQRTGAEIVEEENINNTPDKVSKKYDLTRKGNIGVMTTQQMIEQERNIYIWNLFTEVVFPDIDKVLVLNVY